MLLLWALFIICFAKDLSALPKFFQPQETELPIPKINKAEYEKTQNKIKRYEQLSNQYAPEINSKTFLFFPAGEKYEFSPQTWLERYVTVEKENVEKIIRQSEIDPVKNKMNLENNYYFLSDPIQQAQYDAHKQRLEQRIKDLEELAQLSKDLNRSPLMKEEPLKKEKIILQKPASLVELSDIEFEEETQARNLEKKARNLEKMKQLAQSYEVKMSEKKKELPASIQELSVSVISFDAYNEKYILRASDYKKAPNAKQSAWSFDYDLRNKMSYIINFIIENKRAEVIEGINDLFKLLNDNQIYIDKMNAEVKERFNDLLGEHFYMYNQYLFPKKE